MLYSVLFRTYLELIWYDAMTKVLHQPFSKCTDRLRKPNITIAVYRRLCELQ